MRVLFKAAEALKRGGHSSEEPSQVGKGGLPPLNFHCHSSSSPTFQDEANRRSGRAVYPRSSCGSLNLRLGYSCQSITDSWLTNSTSIVAGGASHCANEILISSKEQHATTL